MTEEDVTLTEEQVQLAIAGLAAEYDMTFDEAVAAEAAGRIPSTLAGTDLTFLIRLLKR